MPQNNENRVLNAHSSEQAENRILNQDKETEKEKQEETQTISEQEQTTFPISTKTEKLSILIPAIPNIWITTSFTLPTVRSLWNRSPLKNSFA